MKTAKEFLKERGILDARQYSINSDQNAITLISDLLTDFANQSKWISVKKSKPEVGKDKAMPMCSELLNIFGRDYSEDGKDIYYKGSGYYEDGKFMDWDGNILEDEAVYITHWQPLPEKP